LAPTHIVHYGGIKKDAHTVIYFPFMPFVPFESVNKFYFRRWYSTKYVMM